MIIAKYLRSEEAATAMEYALFVAGIALAIVTVVFTFGDELRQAMETLAAAIATETAG